MERMVENDGVKSARELNVVHNRIFRGRPKKAWNEMVTKELSDLGLCWAGMLLQTIQLGKQPLGEQG